MAGSTGSPLNLNLFDGADDIVKALTDYFNQNMNIINKSDAHVKVWTPNTAYQGFDIVKHPYHNSLLYTLSPHTSSNSTTEADWSANDGSKWLNLSFAPAVVNWMSNMNYNVGDLLMDGFELKRATTGGSTTTLDRTRHSFIGSRVANWSPNTNYNVGDLAYIGNLNATDNTVGTFKSTIVRCISTHTSSIQFPASTENKWEIVNLESYTYLKTIDQGNGLMGNYRRKGNTVIVTNASPTNSSVRLSTRWNTMARAGTIPVPVRPTVGQDVLSNVNDFNNIFIRRFNTDGSIEVKQAWGSDGDTGSNAYFTETSPHWFTDAAPVWASAVPTF